MLEDRTAIGRRALHQLVARRIHDDEVRNRREVRREDRELARLLERDGPPREAHLLRVRLQLGGGVVRGDVDELELGCAGFVSL